MSPSIEISDKETENDNKTFVFPTPETKAEGERDLDSEEYKRKEWETFSSKTLQDISVKIPPDISSGVSIFFKMEEH